MALSGTISGSYRGYTLQTVWTAAQNIAGNFSDITATHRLICESSYSLYISSRNNTCTIDGTTKSFTSPSISTGGGQTITLGTTTQRVYHNPDGTKSFEIRTVFNIQATISGVYVGSITASGNVTLDRIPRQATITNANNFTDEQNPSFSYSNAGSFPMTAYLEYGGTQITKAIGSATSGTVTFDLTEAQRTAMRDATPNSPTMAVTYGLQTTISGVQYTTTAQRTMTIVNANPSAVTLTYSDTNSTTVAITGDNQKIIQNQSVLTATVGTSTAFKGASIVSYSTTISGVTVAGNGTISIGTINLSTNGTLTTTVTDSRGFTAKTSVTVTIEAWQDPTAIVTLYRINNFETSSKLTVDGNFSSLDGENVLTCEYCTKRADQSTYGSWTPIQNDTETTISLDNLYEWTVQVRIKDLLSGYVTYYTTIGKGLPIFFIDTDKRSIGINCFPVRDGSVEINGTGSSRYLGRAIANGLSIAASQFQTHAFGTFDFKSDKSLEQVTGGGVKVLYDGVYRITFNVRWADVSSNGNNCCTGVSINDSTTDDAEQTVWQYNSQRLTANGSILRELQAGDVIKLLTFANSATTISTAIMWFEEVNIEV